MAPPKKQKNKPGTTKSQVNHSTAESYLLPTKMVLKRFKLGHDSRKKCLLRPEKLGRSDSQIGRSYSANYGFFCQFKRKLAITQAIVIKWKAGRLCLYGERMKMSPFF